MDINEKMKSSISSLQKSALDFSIKGDYGSAIIIWKKILTLREDANTYNTIGDLYIKKREQDEALKFFTQAADMFKTDGFYEKAMAIYKKILNIVPFEVNALSSLADLYAKKGLTSNAVAYYVKAAEKLSRDKQTDKSIDIYNKILQLTPSDINIKIKMADMWLSRNLTEKAANEYASIAFVCLERDELDRSIEFFSKAISSDPQNVASFIGLSNLAERQNNTGQALEFAEKALLYSQNDKDILSKYIQLATNAGKTEDAKNTLSKLILSSPEDIVYKKMLGSIYIREGQPDKAWEEFHPFIDELLQDQNWDEAYELLQLFKELSSAPVKQRLATVYRGKGDIESLTGELEDLAKIFEDQGASQNALVLYKELAELQPDNISLKNKIGEIELSLDPKIPLSPGDLLQEAEISVERQTDEAPQDDFQDKRTEAELYANQGLINEAINIYEELLARDPDNVEIQKQIQSLRSVPSTDTPVIEECEIAEETDQSEDNPVVSEINPASGAEEEDYESHYTAGIEYKQKGLLDDAIREFQIAAKDPERRVLSSKMIASCYMERKEYPHAIAEFNKILENMSPDEGNYLRIKYELAEAYMSSDDYDKAIETYIEIHERDPEFRDVSDKIHTLKEDHESPGPSLDEAEISVERQTDEAPQDDFQDKRTEAEFYANQGLINEAINIYEELLARDPDNPEIQKQIQSLRSVPSAEISELEDRVTEVETAQSGDNTIVNEKHFDPGTDEEDYESHYAAGIEYKQKGLFNDAIREFQIAARDPERRVLTSRMIASCYMERNVEFLSPFLSSILNVLTTMAKMKATAGKPAFKEDEIAKGDVTGLIGLASKQARGTLAISFTEPVIREITKRMLDEGEIDVDNYTADTAGEITNILTAGGRKILSEKGYKFDMAIPTVISGKDHIIRHKSTAPVIIVPFVTEAGNFFIEFCFETLTSLSETSKTFTKSKKGRVSFI